METKKTLLVTGANSQIGLELQQIYQNYPLLEFVFLSREGLDISKPEDIAAIFNKYKPEFCINCAAYTAVDKAEKEEEREAVLKSNFYGVVELASACQEHKTKLIHYSTDYVFPGLQETAYTEADATSPINFYGESKLLGESAASSIANAVVIRTSWVYSPFGNNFVKTMMRLMATKPEINVVSDQIGCPTSAADIALATMSIISHPNWVWGIYHFSSNGKISWYEFAEEIKRNIQSHCIINPITTDEYPTLALRPKFSLLNTDKIVNQYQVGITDWKKSLLTCMQRMV